MFITLLKADGVKTINDYHKILHKVFHTADQKASCPRYTADGSMLYVQSSEKPLTDKCVLASTETSVPTGSVIIEMTIASVVRVNGKNHAINPGDYGTKLRAKFRKYMDSIGITVVEDTFAPCGFVVDMDHKSRLPKCRIVAKCECDDADVLEKFAVTGYGRAKYLGLGLPIIKAVTDAGK